MGLVGPDKYKNFVFEQEVVFEKKKSVLMLVFYIILLHNTINSTKSKTFNAWTWLCENKIANNATHQHNKTKAHHKKAYVVQLFVTV